MEERPLVEQCLQPHLDHFDQQHEHHHHRVEQRVRQQRRQVEPDQPLAEILSRFHGQRYYEEQQRQREYYGGQNQLGHQQPHSQPAQRFRIEEGDDHRPDAVTETPEPQSAALYGVYHLGDSFNIFHLVCSYFMILCSRFYGFTPCNDVLMVDGGSFQYPRSLNTHSGPQFLRLEQQTREPPRGQV